ncbi:hypothetical protein TH3_04175 [Thalassospira xiamenensis M-5 = DSM 17429]|uniref:Uncharacterized protein n=1 Tax=Thalassospira xiamenensis M-5 = DSM 17429 TaxID=1123366 RepID=A0AB72U9Z8_9PROT|nr:hypothetical protein TH3_04175 [Thalassospira xiamenensis M-5 = DSM 17429]
MEAPIWFRFDGAGVFPLNPTNASLTHSITFFFDQDHMPSHAMSPARGMRTNSGNGVNIGQTSVF